jgi:hypothetical protein
LVNTRRVLAGALALGLGIVPITPPEHVHEEEGTHHLLIHRHLQSHELGRHDGDHPTFDDDNDPVLTLTAVYTASSSPSVPHSEAAAVYLVEPPTPNRPRRAITDFEILIHGPPRAPTSPRGPPSCLPSNAAA